MNYCSDCGAAIIQKIPDDDNRLRHVCGSCELIHYQNPKIVAGCLPVYEDKVLLCKRAIEPRSGFWTLPAGFMELGETTPEAASRETMEEANARVDQLQLFTVFNLPQVGQVYMMFLSRLLDEGFSPGVESHEVGLYKEEDIPWDNIAFPTIKYTLDYFYSDRRRGQYQLHTGDIIKDYKDHEFIPGSKTAHE